MEKLNLIVLFGGESGEHDVSLRSAFNVLSAVDREKYNVIPVGITKEGKWYLYEGSIEDIKSGSWQSQTEISAVLSPDKGHKGLIVTQGNSVKVIKADVVFPVLHGNNGEDGTVQGLCALAGIPCVGPDMISSAICMDKAYAKTILKYNGIPQADWVSVNLGESIDDAVESSERRIGYPCFIKPSNAGSSLGASKAVVRDELINAIEKAFAYDDTVLIEEYIDCREIEVAVLGNDNPTASAPGEIVTDSVFYDYETKYQSQSGVSYIIPAKLDVRAQNKIRDYALKAYRLLGCSGMSRVDFFVDKKNGRVILNEINTIPGFTDISMYPKLRMNEGMSYGELVDTLITLAIEKKRV